jgi:hypothetical protein
VPGKAKERICPRVDKNRQECGHIIQEKTMMRQNLRCELECESQ